MNRPYLPEQTDVENPQRLSLFAALAIAGQVVLFASAWLLPAVSEYSLIGDNMSELVLGDFGFVQAAAFLFAGFTTLGLAYALRKLTAGSWGSAFGSLLVAIYGIGAILGGIFPTDRVDAPADVWSQSTTGMIHMVTALVSFVCMIVSMFVLTRTFAGLAQWRSLTVWSAVFAGAALAQFLGQGEGPRVGLAQRLMVAAISAWMVVAAFRARAIVKRWSAVETPI